MEIIKKQPTTPKKESKFSLKKLISISLAISFTLVTFYIERNLNTLQTISLYQNNTITSAQGSVEISNNENQWQPAINNSLLSASTKLRTQEGSSTIQFKNNSYLTLAPNTEVSIYSPQATNNNQIITINKGRIWFNNQYSYATTNILGPKTTLIPESASLEIEVKNNILEVKNFNGITAIGLTTESPATPEIIKFNNRSKFINSFILTSKHQTSIEASKIAPILKSILYSKLIKEFNYGTINYQNLDDWSQQQLQANQQYQTTLSNLITQQAQKRNLQIQNLQPTESLQSQLANTLTLSHHKRIKSRINHSLKNLQDAEHLTLTNQETLAKLRIKEFQKSINEITSSNQNIPIVINSLEKELQKYQALEAQDPTFKIKNTLLQIIFDNLNSISSQTGDKTTLLKTLNLNREFIYSTSLIIDQNTNTANQLLNQYNQNIDDFLQQNQKHLSSITKNLAEENQILNQLIAPNPKLYTDRNFNSKSLLENSWIQQLPPGNELREEKQTLIAEKVKLLQKLQHFFFNEKISVENAKDIVSRLTQEISQYQENKSQVAVQKLFSQQLQDFENFWRYLNAPEYSSATATLNYGKTHKERYQKFLTATDQAKEIDSLKNTIIGTPEPQTTTESAKTTTQIISELELFGLSSIQVSPITKNTQTSTQINGQYQSQEFIATYYWRNKTLENMTLDGEQLNIQRLKIGQLASYLESLKNTPQNSTTSTTTKINEPEIETRARIIVKQRLNEEKIPVTLNNVNIIDLDKTIFQVTDLQINENPEILISFQFNSKQNLVSEINIKGPEYNRNLTGTLSINKSNLIEVVLSLIQEDIEPLKNQ